MLGEYRWLTVRTPGTKYVRINLEMAKTKICLNQDAA